MNTATAANHKNPFPGLRPFQEDEEYLFFGRENQVDAMVDKLAATRFLAVVGTSGSGKSSLVNCGLRPALHGGLMARAGTAWRMAQFRPGSDPMRAMARALARDGVLFRDYQAGGLTLAEIVDTTLRMSKLGLIDIYEQAQLGEDVNLLVVVDQFEELFRYRQFGAGQQQNATGVSEEATAFVNLLLAVKEQTRYPIYVVLTMRSDFLGDCTQFPGLAEAINAGQYLVPRMIRDERRAAISGPVGVGGSETSPVLLTRLVNDVGDNPDQLSILQHALNRTWNQWERSGDNGPLDLPHYEAIGTMAHALDQHAERAYAELATARQQQICEKLFKALTDKATDSRGVRRPTMLGTLCALADATRAEVTQVIDVFRQPSRSFLMPPAGDTLEAETVIDISHESLMRVWERLKTWADEEAQSAHIYSRLAETAVLHGEGKAGLWNDPDLQVALDWQEKNQPNKDWARRYDPGFEGAIAFLQASEKKRADDEAERQRQQNAEVERAQRELQQAQALAEAQQQRAEAERQKAEEQQQRLEQQAKAAAALAEAQQLRAEAERRKVEEQRQRLDQQAKAASRMRLLLAALAVVALLALGSTVFAFSAYKRADAATKTAVAATRDAVREKEKAVAAEIAAKGEREKADIARKKAAEEESKAVKSKDNAEKQRKRAEAQTLLAQNSAKKAERERKNAEDAATRATESGKIAAENAKAALDQLTVNRELLYASNIGISQKALEDNNSERAQKLLAGLLDQPKDLKIRGMEGEVSKEPEDLRGFEWYYLWGIANRKQYTIKKVRGSIKPVLPVAFGPSNDLYVTGGSDNITRVSGLSSPAFVALPAQTAPLRAISWINDKVFATADPTAVKIWSVEGFTGLATSSDQISVTLKHTIVLRNGALQVALASSPDGKYMAIGSDGTFMLWNGNSNEVTTLADGGKGAPSVSFVEEGKTLVTYDGSKFTRWNVATQQPSEIKLLMDNNHQPPIKSVAFTPNAKTMVTTSTNAFMLWTADTTDPTKYTYTRMWPAHKEPAHRYSEYDLVIAISSDGEYLATGDGTDVKNGGGVKVWKMETAGLNEPLTLSPDVEYPQLLAFTDRNTTLVVSGPEGLQFWDIRNKTKSRSFRELLSVKAPLIFAPDRNSLVTINNDEVRLWSYTRLSGTLGFDSKRLAFSDNKLAIPDSETPVAISATEAGDKTQILATRTDESLKLWKISAGKTITLRATIKGDVGGQAAFSPDGKTIATTSRLDSVEWWNTDTDQTHHVKPQIMPSRATTMAFSPDGKMLAVGGGSSEATSGLVKLWNAKTATHELVRDIAGHVGVGIYVTAVAFSPDSQILVTGGGDKTVELRNVNNGELLATLVAHTFPVTSVAYSADGKTIASGDKGGIVNVWSASSRQLLLTLKASSDPIAAVSFAANGNALFTSDEKGSIQVWPATPRRAVERLLQQTSSAASRFNFDSRRSVGPTELKHAFLRRLFLELED